TAPQPDIMVAAEGFQPGIDGQGVMMAQTLAVPGPPPSPLMTPATTITATTTITSHQPPAGALAPVPRTPIFQMAPIISEANAGEIHAAAASAPGVPVQGQIVPVQALQPNRMPERPVFKGVMRSRFYVHAGQAMSEQGARELSAALGNL